MQALWDSRRMLLITTFLTVTFCAVLSLEGCAARTAESPIDANHLQNEVLSGTWTHESGQFVLTFDGNRSFSYEEPGKTWYGSYLFDGQDMVLYDKKEQSRIGRMDADGRICLADLDGCFRLNTPGSAAPGAEFAGEWKHSSGSKNLQLAEDGTFLMMVRETAVRGRWQADGDSICLYGEDGSTMDEGCVDESGVLRMESEKETDEGFYRTDGVNISSAFVPYAERYGLTENLSFGAEPALLEHGAAYMNQLGSYAAVPAFWQMIRQEAPAVKPGFRAATFTAYCFLRSEHNPRLDGDYQYFCSTQFYDYDTGTVLMMNRNSLKHGTENTYSFVVYTAQGKAEIDIILNGVGWTGPAEECDDVLRADFTAIFPEWYSGLMLAALPVEPSLEQHSEAAATMAEMWDVQIKDLPDCDVSAGLRIRIQ